VLEFFVIIGTFWFFYKAYVGLQTYKLLSTFRVPAPNARSVAAETIPEGIRDALMRGSLRIDSQGFERLEFCEVEHVITASERGRYGLVLIHRETDSFALFTNSSAPNCGNELETQYFSFFSDGVLLTRTLGAFDKQIQTSTNVITVATYDPVELWEAHRKRRSELMINDVRFRTSEYVDTSDICERRNRQSDLELQELVEQNVLIRCGDNYRFGFKSVLSLGRSLNKYLPLSNALEKKSMEEVALDLTPDISDIELEAFHWQRHLLEQQSSSRAIKFSIFVVSGIAFSALFGFLFSFEFVALLFPVVLFHELGHFLAMRLFGYRDLHMFFVPLGAAVTGRNDEVKPWQEAIVLLAGPVPGIGLAVMALFFIQDPDTWIRELAFISLWINYFNLLPFPPLDGGQLMQLVLLDRYPILKMLIRLLSIVLFGAMALFFQDGLLVVFVLLLSYLAYQEFTEWRNKKLGTEAEEFELTPDIGVDAQIKEIFQWLRNERVGFATKFVIVASKLEGAKKKRLPKATEAVFIFSSYVFVFTFPMVGVFHYGINIGADYNEHENTVEYWDNKIDQEADSKQKAELLLEATEWWMYSDIDLASGYLRRAKDLEKHSEDPLLSSSIVVNEVKLLTLTEQNDDAIALFKAKQAILLASSDQYAFALGFVSAYLDDQEAIPYLRKGIEASAAIDEPLVTRYYWIALRDRHLALKDFKSAEHSALQAARIEIDGETDAMILADTYVAIDQVNKAKSVLEEMLSQLSGEEKYHFIISLGWIHLHLGSLEEAEANFVLGNRLKEEVWKSEFEEKGSISSSMLGNSVYDSMKKPYFEQQLVLADLRNDKELYQHYLRKIKDLHNSHYMDQYIDTRKTMREYAFGIYGLKATLIADALLNRQSWQSETVSSLEY